MTRPERWTRIQELFEAAVQLAPAAREGYLLRECGGDAALRAEVAALIAADERSTDAFLADLVRDAARHLAEAEAASWVGRRVGPYRLLGELARGGMGTVYLAERADAAYDARVAIKFVRGAVAGPEVVRRFLAERQILADLAHPNIALLLDGGATEDGTPYLVMEHIDGRPIDAYVEDRGLDVPARLVLFRKVCDAVQHAHRHLVVHRDIKPSNILVTADGTPKLLDFGVAKLLDAGDGQDVTETALAVGLLTPAYASPEQVRGNPITTATDQYSLGVLLYRLLTGALPYGEGVRRGPALARAILEEPPEPPSRAARRAADGGPAREGELDPDFDAIVLMALEKDPSRRYPSVEALADDVARYLERKPVKARPATRAYLLRKLVSRHRGAVVAGAVLALLVLGLTAFYTARLAHERDLARQEARKAEQVSAFLERLFRVSDPSEARGATITAREVLDSAAARVPTELAGQPEVEAALLHTLGSVYASLGLHADAQPILERGLSLRVETGGDGRPTPGEFLYRLGMAGTSLGQFDSAAVLLREATVQLDSMPALADDAVGARLSLVNALRRAGRLPEADSVVRDAIARARRSGADSLVAAALSTRAALLIAQRRGEEAEPVAREAWERRVALSGEDDPRTITALNSLGQALYVQSRFAEAEPIMREVLALRRRVHGEDSPLTGTAWNNLSALLQSQGHPADAEPAARRALEIWRASYGEKHQRVSLVMSNLGSMLLALGRPVESEEMHRAALAIMQEVLAPGHLNIAASYNNLAHTMEADGRLSDAEAAYRAALAEVAKGGAADSPIRATFMANLGRVLNARDDAEGAEAALREALAIQRERLPSPHARTATTLTLLGHLLVETDRASEAEPLLREALGMRTAVLGPDHWGIQVTRSVLGQSLAELGRTPEADRMLSGSAAALEDRLGIDDARTRAAVERAARFYDRIGDRRRGAAMRERLGTGDAATGSPPQGGRTSGRSG